MKKKIFIIGGVLCVLITLLNVSIGLNNLQKETSDFSLRLLTTASADPGEGGKPGDWYEDSITEDGQCMICDGPVEQQCEAQRYTTICIYDGEYDCFENQSVDCFNCEDTGNGC